MEQEEPKEQEGHKESKKSSKPKQMLKKIWHFLWEEDSLLSYLAFILIAFILLRFIAFPGFLLVSGYSDVAAVVSGSMDHEGEQFEHSFDAWLKFHDFDQTEFEQWPYQNGLNVGDVILVKKVPVEDIQVGDVILFYSNKGQIIHRVLYVNEVGEDTFYTTKGDANPAVSPIEKDIPYDNVKGKLVNKVPYLGYLKVIFSYLIPFR